MERDHVRSPQCLKLLFKVSLQDKTGELGVGKMKKGLFVLASLLAMSSIASATVEFDYGNYVGATVDFLQVKETTSEDLLTSEGWFGAPDDPAGLGDSLFFTPNNFSVQSSGGGFDYKDSKLEFTIDANPGRDIDSVEVEEAGAYSLIGAGTATYAEVWAGGTFTINRVVLDDVESVVNHTVPIQMVFKRTDPPEPWGDGKFELGIDPSPSLWEGELNIDVDQILLDAGIAGKASEVYFVIDNKLTAVSESGSLSSIDKKSAGGFVVTVPQVPEPATMALLGLGGLLLRRRK